MKEFDYEKAKAGAPVCTRDGRPARIICWDRKDALYPIIVLAERNGVEIVNSVTDRGYIFSNGTRSDGDLFMAPVKHEGWVNVYTPSSEGKYIVSAVAYDTEADAKKAGLKKSESYVAIVKIEWEE
ncbi:MAG: hypothetical protein Q4D30_01265 [Bacteroidales bacterium]|nr:hypothetical protein [Bacteroidales bacterium]